LVIELDDLETRFAERRRGRRFRRSLEITNEGFLLGADTLLASRALDGEEPRALALLAAAHGPPYRRKSSTLCEKPRTSGARAKNFSRSSI
jgi:hypothetical protein